MKVKKLSALLVSLGLIISMTACGNDKKTEATKAATEETTVVSNVDDEGVATDEVSYPLEITDSTGTVITIEAKPEKVVSISPAMTEMMFQLNLGDLLVARTDYCDYPSDASSVESIGTLFEPNVEKILALEPDVILCSAIVSEDLLAKFKEANIPVVVLYDDTKYDAVYEIINTFGLIFNCTEETSKIVSEMTTTVSDVEANVADKEKVTVYYAVSFGEYGDYTATGETYINQMIELAGGENIAKDLVGWTISLEEIVEADPDVILIGTGMAELFSTTEGYKDLTAVKEGRVYEIDVNLLDRQGYRNAEGIALMSQLFFGEE